MMRTLMVFSCMLLIGLMYACTSTVETEPVETAPGVETTQKADIVQLGWIDGDTFRSRGNGAGKDKAVSSAQLIVMEKFIAERMKASGMKFDARSTGVAIVDEFGSMVKAGSIVREKQESGGMVSIIYEVKANNLKSRVRSMPKQ